MRSSTTRSGSTSWQRSTPPGPSPAIETSKPSLRSLAATAEGILCLTAIETAVAAAEALDPAVVDRLAEVRSLGEWVPGAPVAV